MYTEGIELRCTDGTLLHAHEWTPEDMRTGRLRGVVCLVHGFGEHGGGKYAALAEKLNAAGYAVLSYDQRGHGRSPGKRGHAASVDQLAEDAAGLLALAARRFPEVPRFLYGHSMGGNVALRCAIRHNGLIQGVIATSPWLRLAFKPPALKVAAGRLLIKLMPEFTLKSEINPGRLYREAEQVPRDPLFHNHISAALFFGMTESGSWLLTHADQLKLPLLLMHGDADRVTSYEASAQFACRIGEPQVTFVTVPGGYHELHNDRDREQTLAYIVDWLNKHSNG